MPQWLFLASPSTLSIFPAQQLLTILGYRLGTVDGMPGNKTTAATGAFQKDNNFPVTGAISSELVTVLSEKIKSVSLDTI